MRWDGDGRLECLNSFFLCFVFVLFFLPLFSVIIPYLLAIFVTLVLLGSSFISLSLVDSPSDELKTLQGHPGHHETVHINRDLYRDGQHVTILPHNSPDGVKWQNKDLDRVIDLVRRTAYDEDTQELYYFNSDGVVRLEDPLSEPGDLNKEASRLVSSMNGEGKQVRALKDINLLFPAWFLGAAANAKFTFTKVDQQDMIGKPLAFYTIPKFIVSIRPRRLTDITLATQCSLSRLETILDIGRSWDGIISLAVYIQHPLSVVFIPDILVGFFLEMEAINPKVKLDISLLFGARFIADPSKEAHPYDFAYPVNALRNLAMDGVDTEFVLNLDCDFLPSDGMHDILSSSDLYSFMKAQSGWQMAAFVIPSFEMLSNFTLPVPFSRSLLDQYCTDSLVIPFHSRFSMPEEMVDKKKAQQWCLGKTKQYHVTITEIQGPTNYPRWFTATEPYYVSLARNKLNRYYEPYMVGLKSLLPRFDERFRGYSFNKRAQMIELQYAQFDLYTLPHVFITHRYHDNSIGKQMMEGSKVFRETVKRTYEDFIVQVRTRYPPTYGAKKLLGSLCLSEFLH